MSVMARPPLLLAVAPVSRRDLELLLERLRRCLEKRLQRPLAAPELLLTDDAGIAGPNYAHLRCPGPTNILAFPDGESRGGSLVLSVEMLRRESLLYGQAEPEHLVRLLAHGLAHLAGYEHGPDMWEVCGSLEAAGLDFLNRR